MTDIPGVHVADEATDQGLRLHSFPTIRLYDPEGNLLIWHSISPKDVERLFTTTGSLTVTLSMSVN